MAKKKALVLTNGQIEQLQTGDYLGEVELLSLINGEAGAIVIGAPVYVSTNDTVKKAKADAAGTMSCIGLVADTSITNAVAGNIQCDGVLPATTAQWDAIAGTSGGLTAGTVYYVSTATAGIITATPPTSGYSQEIGVGVSTTELYVRVKRMIKL